MIGLIVRGGVLVEPVLAVVDDLVELAHELLVLILVLRELLPHVAYVDLELSFGSFVQLLDCIELVLELLHIGQRRVQPIDTQVHLALVAHYYLVQTEVFLLACRLLLPHLDFEPCYLLGHAWHLFERFFEVFLRQIHRF